MIERGRGRDSMKGKLLKESKVESLSAVTRSESSTTVLVSATILFSVRICVISIHVITSVHIYSDLGHVFFIIFAEH